jgi:hypothetical protein
MHDELQNSQASVVSDNLVCVVKTQGPEDRRFPISSLSLHFQQISRTILYETVKDRLYFRKLCSPWVLKMLSEEHQK